MGRKKYTITEAKLQRWIKEGRGSGRNQEYKPWITVRDVPSEGRSHRVFGHKSQRTHHFLSDLELAVFLLFEWHVDTEEIREQFPLQRDTTLKIAKEAGIKHPSSSGVMIYMTSDFLINSEDPEQPKFVLQAKYADSLTDQRTVEKLELERRYWLQKEVPWLLITENEIDRSVFRNINWLYPAQRDEVDHALLVQRTEVYANHFHKHPNKRVVEICKSLDVAYDLPPGESLSEIRQLLANRYFCFDISIPTTKLKASELKSSITDALLVANHV